MVEVRCVSDREDTPGSLEVGRTYWLDEESIYELNERKLGAFHVDSKGEKYVGNLDIDHFEKVVG